MHSRVFLLIAITLKALPKVTKVALDNVLRFMLLLFLVIEAPFVVTVEISSSTSLI